MPHLFPGKYTRIAWFLFFVLLAGCIMIRSDGLAAMPEKVNAVYLPSHCFTERKITEFSYYAGLTGFNAVVLHVKDPHGTI